jgi:hypothetical protein
MIWAYGVSGGAVLLLGVALCAGHWLKSSASFVDYLWGAGTWSVAVAAKYPLAAVVYGVLYIAFPGGIPLVVDMPTSGLLTGATQCRCGVGACLDPTRCVSACYGENLPGQMVVFDGAEKSRSCDDVVLATAPSRRNGKWPRQGSERASDGVPNR